MSYAQEMAYRAEEVRDARRGDAIEKEVRRILMTVEKAADRGSRAIQTHLMTVAAAEVLRSEPYCFQVIIDDGAPEEGNRAGPPTVTIRW